MPSPDARLTLLRQWSSLLGRRPDVGPEQPGRELWPVTAEDGREYVLKRLGPWRNLPVADQARVLAHLSRSGVEVAEFVITDDARLFAGEVEDSFILLPHLAHDRIDPAESLPVEGLVGRSVALLHQALAAYPWSANSYRELITESLDGELLLPDDVRELFAPQRAEVTAAIDPLELQLVHGDLTPDNVLVSRSEGSAALIDLDHLPLAPRVWDIGKYLSRRQRRLPPAAALENVSRFVAGYHHASALSEPELRALPASITAINLLEASWTTRILTGRLERRLLPAQKAELEPTLDALRWQFRHEPALADAVRAGVDRASSPEATAR